MGVSTEEPKFMDEEDLSDDDEPKGAHKTLLNAVSQLYKKQRISAPKRREPAQEISEFNLTTNTEAKGNKIHVNELLSDLKEKVTHKEINKKVKEAQKKSAPLPKPLEKNEADKIHRAVGYESVKRKLDRWETIVERNRLATTLSFPLPQKPLQKEPPNFLTTFQKQSDLEKAMAEILQKSEIAQEERKMEDELSKLSVEEMIQRRNMMKKMKARESYQIAKNVRQNKIKSKKYHRILKRERIKQELVNFEKLQKTDPEAALAKLEQIERARAEERISLRHRNTGKWAQSRAIRAKYDTEARQQLAEQLAKSRELTQKIRNNDSSDSEDESADEEEVSNDVSSIGSRIESSGSKNPWLDEFSKFISGFEDFSKERQEKMKRDAEDAVNHSENEDINSSPSSEARSKPIESNGTIPIESHASQEEPEPSLTHHDSNIETPSSEANPNLETAGRSSSVEPEVSSGNDISDIEASSAEQENESAITDSFIQEDLPSTGVNPEEDTIKEINDVEATDTEACNKPSEISVSNEELNGNQSQTNTLNTSLKHNSENRVRKTSETNTSAKKFKSPEKNNISVNSTPDAKNILNGNSASSTPTVRKNILNDNSTSNTKKLKTPPKKLIVSEEASPKKSIDSFAVDDDTSETETNKSHIPKTPERTKIDTVLNNSGAWSVESTDSSKRKKLRKRVRQKQEKSLNDLFDDAEEVILKHTENAVGSIKEDLKKAVDEPDEDERKRGDRPPPKKQAKRAAGLEEALIEVHEDGISSGVNDLTDLKDKLTKPSSDKPQKEPQIDPNKHLNVKAQKLFSEIGDIVEEGESSGEEENSQKMHLMEAFADDDIAEEFSKEKENEAKKNAAQIVDLSMPGWGSWAGGGLPNNPKRKGRRVNRRFIRLPKIPRKDENRPTVIINEDTAPKLKEKLVNELPYPFTSVKDYEASVRAPIGKNWVPEKAFKKLTVPPVVTKMGTIIEPMSDEVALMKGKKRRK